MCAPQSADIFIVVEGNDVHAYSRETGLEILVVIYREDSLKALPVKCCLTRSESIKDLPIMIGQDIGRRLPPCDLRRMLLNNRQADRDFELSHLPQ